MGSSTFVCGLDAAMHVIGGKWKALILWELRLETRRFAELRRLLPGISEKMLAQHLRALEAHGIVHREVHPEVPPRVEYSLTPLGESLNAALGPLGDWGDAYVARGAGPAAADPAADPVAEAAAEEAAAAE